MSEAVLATSFIAVRPRAAVEAGAAELARRCSRSGADDARGALAACGWALDPVGPAPVTGWRVVGVPTELDLAIEERAAIERARDSRCPAADRDFARGVALALEWMLGFDPIEA